MKTSLAIAGMLVCYFNTSGQLGPRYDFAKVDLSAVDANALQRRIDSLSRSSGLDSLIRLRALKRANTHTPRYTAIAFGYGYYSANYRDLSQHLNGAGLSTLREQLHGLAFSGEFHGKRFSYLYATVFLPSQEVSGTAYDVRVNGATLENIFGYAVLNKPKFQISPFLGFSYNEVSIQTEWRTGPANIREFSDLLGANGRTTINQSQLSLLGGCSFDYHAKYSPAGRGIIVGARFGTGLPLIEGRFRYRGEPVDYAPTLRLNDFFAAVLIKSYLKAPDGFFKKTRK